MNNQNKILRQRQLEDTGDEIISFHEDEEEHNYLGKKELVEIEGDKSIDPDYSYDDDRSKLSTIKRNTNTELMKLLTDSTTELYQRKSGTNNLSINDDFSKDLSRDNDINNMLNSKNFNAPLSKNNNIIITPMNDFGNENNKFNNILQQIPTKIDNNFFYGTSGFNTNYNNNILTNKNNMFINNNNNLNSIKRFNNNNNKKYQINSFNYFIQGKTYNTFNQSNPSFGIMQSTELEKNYKELEKSYNEVLNLIQYWQNFYLDIAKLVSENININKDDPFSDEFKFAVIDNVKSIVKLAKQKAFSIFEICKEGNLIVLNNDKKNIVKNKEYNFIPFHNLNFQINNNKEKEDLLLMYSKENSFMIQRMIKLNNENNKTFKRKKYYKEDDSLDSLPPVIYRKYITEGTNTDNNFINEKIIIKKEIVEKPIIKEIPIKYFPKEKLKTNKNNSFTIKKEIKKIILNKTQNSTPKNSNRQNSPSKNKILKITTENIINIFQKPKKEKIKIFKVQQSETEMKYFDIEKLELLNRELSLQISESEKEKNQLKKTLEDKIKLLSEKENENKNLNTESNIINTNNSNLLLNNSYLFLPEMIPPEQTYKIFIHCVKHFKYEEENYKKYMEEEDLQNLKLFVNKMEKYLIGTSYPVQRKPESIYYYKPIESAYQKKYKESILTGIKPLTISKSRTGSNKKSIDYRSYSTVNNNSTFNKYKAVIKALKNS